MILWIISFVVGYLLIGLCSTVVCDRFILTVRPDDDDEERVLFMFLWPLVWFIGFLELSKKAGVFLFDVTGPAVMALGRFLRKMGGK